MIWGLSLVLILLANANAKAGDKIKVPAWKMGMKPFTKCVTPGKLTTGLWSLYFFQVLKSLSHGIQREVIMWKR